MPRIARHLDNWHQHKMNRTSKALMVHMFTATGAVFAMLAMLEAVQGAWNKMFFWLVVALIVDGIDGPLARRYQVKTYGARIDGVLLDLIIDYLTYVFVPAYALFKSGLLPGWTGWLGIFAITFASALYFADTRMKTADKSFSGFPGCWNMVVLVLFAIGPTFWTTLTIVAVLAVMMFLPVKFIHPVRTARWRQVSLPVALLWCAFAGWAIWVDFAEGSWAHWGLVATSLYLLTAGAAQQVLDRQEARSRA